MISFCLDETTDITSSARLAIFARYCSGHEMYEELLSLETLSSNTTGKDICEIVVNMLRERNRYVKNCIGDNRWCSQHGWA